MARIPTALLSCMAFQYLWSTPPLAPLLVDVECEAIAGIVHPTAGHNTAVKGQVTQRYCHLTTEHQQHTKTNKQ
jgi:hypothetical protein